MILAGSTNNWWESPLAQQLLEPATSAPAPEQFREAAGVNVDADDDDWRRLTGDGMRDLAPMTQARMQKLAHFLWESNLLANRLIEVPIAYLLSQGVTWRVEDPESQQVLDRHWKDGINAYDIKLPKKVRELGMFGEQCYPVFRDESSGFVRLGYLDPALIETVVTDPENREQPIGIVTCKNRKGEAKRYRVIVNVPDTAFAERTAQIRETFTDGDCFYFRVNDLSSSTRGRSDLLAQMDWLDAYDQFLFGETERAAAMRAFFWDVTLEDATPEEVEAKAKKIVAPRFGATRVHNQQEVWEAVSPTLQSYDSERTAKLIRNHMLGGATMPEHWYGGADGVNLTMGDSMTQPTEKMLDMRRNYIGYLLLQIATYVLLSKWDAIDRVLTEKEQNILDTLKVEWPSLTAKDTTKYAAALQQMIAAVTMAIDAGLLTRATGLRLVAAMAEELGVEIDVEEELTKAQKELSDKGGNTLDGLDLTDTHPENVPQAKPPKPVPAAA